MTTTKVPTANTESPTDGMCRKVATLKPWKPGQSGNPSGLPKVKHDLIRHARLHSEEALETALSIMRDGRQKGSTRLAAAGLILDRAWGKASLRVAVEDPSSAASRDEEFKQIFAQAAERAIRSLRPVISASGSTINHCESD